MFYPSNFSPSNKKKKKRWCKGEIRDALIKKRNGYFPKQSLPEVEGFTCLKKALSSLKEVVLWLKSLPRSVTWAFPFCSPIISWARGAQPNPSSSKRCGQQSARCDHQLITHYPHDRAPSRTRCEASSLLNTLTGRSAVDRRLPPTGFVSGLLWTVRLSPVWESGGSEGRSVGESAVRLTFKLRFNYFLFIGLLWYLNFIFNWKECSIFSVSLSVGLVWELRPASELIYSVSPSGRHRAPAKLLPEKFIVFTGNLLNIG